MPRVRLLVSRAAEVDAQEIYDWYEHQSAGLGEAFLVELVSTYERIAMHPFLYQRGHREIRRAITRRFPFSIFYVFGGEQVDVLAVRHQFRDPELMKSRLLIHDRPRARQVLQGSRP